MDVAPPRQLDRFVPRRLCERLVGPGGTPERAAASRFEACVLLADVSGFTAFSEQLSAKGALGAEQVQEMLNLCFGRLTDLIEAHGGEVIGFAGDAALALWCGAGFDLPPHAAASAARCAEIIRDQVDGLDAPGGFPIRLRCVVASGPVWAATLGGDEGRWQLLVGGSPLDRIGNALARAKKGEVVLDVAPSEATGAPGAAGESTGMPTAAGPFASEAGLRAFIPRTIQARIDAGQTEWLAEFRRVTVMFIGLGRIDLARHVESGLLQRAFHSMQEAIHESGGAVTQTLIDDKGASLLAAWGIPLHAHEDDASRAVSAGVVIDEALRAQGLAPSTGIATGRVWTGIRGNARRAEFAMIGDVVNLAARLMQAAAGGVLCDARTQLDVGPARGFEEVASLELKGKRERVPAFRPQGARKVETSRSLPPLIGRDTEKRVLFGALETLATRSRGGLIVLSGEPGVGKSHLVAAMLERAQASGLRCEVGSGTAIRTSGAYAAFREVFRRLLGLDMLADAEDQRRRLSALLDGAPGSLVSRAPLLRGVLGVEWDEDEITREMGAQARAETTRELLVWLFRAASRGSATLLVLEDAHWLDSSTWALAADLWEQSDALILVVATRPLGEGLPRDARRLIEHADAQRLELDALAPDEVEALVCQRLGVTEVPRSIAALVQEKSEGHPFFAEELAYALRDRGILEVADGRCTLRDSGASAASLPDRVEDVVTSRIDLLTPEQQITLKVASVLGRGFELTTLADVHPIGGAAEARAGELAAMTRLGLVLPEGPSSYVFKHAITQQVTYELLPFAQRRRLHQAVAEWHERSLADLSPHFGLLAHHWRRAEDATRALGYLEKAGDQALKDFANEEAARFFGEALELTAEEASRAEGSGDARLRRACWRRRLGEAVSNLGQIEPAVTQLEAALGELGRPLPRSDRGWALTVGVELLRQLSRRASPWFRPRASPADLRLREQIQALGVLGADYYVLDRILPFIGTLLAATSVAERAGPSGALAIAYANLGNVAGIVPLHALARAYGRLALEVAERVDQPAVTARVLGRTAIYGGSVARWQVEDLLRSMELAERVGDDFQWEESAIILSVHRYHRAEFERCAELGRKVCERTRRTRSLVHLLWGLTTEAQCALLLGGAKEAAELCRTAIARLDVDGGPDRDSAIKAHGLLASACTQLGDRDAAVASATAAARLIERFGRVGYQSFPGSSAVAEFYLARWEAGEALPDGESPAERARWACRYLSGYARRFAPARPRALLFAGRSDWIGGSRQRALRAWQRSLVSARELGMPYDEALAHGELAARLGPQAGRAEHAARAASLFEMLRTPLELARVRALL